MKIAKIITIAAGTNAFSFHHFDFEICTENCSYSCDYYDCSTTTTADYGTEGWSTTASTTTEELTTTLTTTTDGYAPPRSTLTTTTDGEYTPPDITTTTMTSTELTSTTNISSSDLGPTIMIDVIDSDDDEKSESLIGGIVEAIGSMVQSLSCYFTEC